MRKDREMQGLEYKSRYFEEAFDEESGEKYYKYVRDYWKDRKKGDWSHLEDLFWIISWDFSQFLNFHQLL